MEENFMDEQISLFDDSNSLNNLTVIDGNLKSDEYQIKCYNTKMTGISYQTVDELFSGFDTIYAITFSYDINFIDKIMKNFKYGEILLGASFLVQKDIKTTEFLIETLTNAKEAADAVRKHPYLSDMVLNGDLVIHTPTFILDHRKICLLKADNGKTRVITTSANMSNRAWNGEHMEFYECDDTEYAYESYLTDFETAWENSEDIPAEIITTKKTDDFIESNAIIKKVKETGKTVILQHPMQNDDIILENIQYNIEHQKIKEEYDKIANINLKSKNGLIEFAPKTVEKLEFNNKKLIQKRKIEIRNTTESYPSMEIDYDEGIIKLNGSPMNLNPTEDEVKNDIEELLGIFNNFDDFVGNKPRLKETHFKLLNAMFCSPYNAKLRCTAKLMGVSNDSLPLFLLATSKTSNSGKTFMFRAILKMMTGKDLNVINKEDCKKEDIRNIQVSCKGIPVFIDEIDNRFFSNNKDTIKNINKCEDTQLETQPMIAFASNNVESPDEPIRKRMVFLSFDGALPSTTDRSAKKGLGDAIIRRLGTGFYREYSRRMLDEVKKLLDYIIYSKDRADSWYPDIMNKSSKTIISILEDYGYTVPSYMKELTWNNDYASNAHSIFDETFKEISDFYSQNKKAFTFTNSHVIIELGNDADSKKRLTSWFNTLPPELEAKNISTRDSSKISVNRKEFEKVSHIKPKYFGIF
jgi:hypothetical protein